MAIRVGRKTLTAREQKTYILNITGWTEREYRNEYFKLRNRVRNFERITGQARGTINVADQLARDQRRRARAAWGGFEYEGTDLFRAISKTTSASTGKPIGERALETSTAAAWEYIYEAYHGIIKNSKFSPDIQDMFARLQASNDPRAVADALDYINGIKSLIEQEKEEVRRYNANSTDPIDKRKFPDS